MTDRDAIETMITECYKAREKGDIDGLMAAFHPDAVFELSGDPDVFAVAGAVEGHYNVRASMAELIESFTFISRKMVSVVIEGERAAVHSRLKVKYNPTNRTFASDVLDTFRFKDGKIVELVEFADTALIRDIVQGKS